MSERSERAGRHSSYLWQTAATIVERRVVGILRAGTGETARASAEAMIKGGLDVVEVSLTTPDAIDAIRALAIAHPDATIGAGTVLDETSARLSILAGARHGN